jgi:hypothetical protein
MSWRDLMPVHPAANIFPMMSDDELVALGEDIRKNGLEVPIAILFDNEKPVLLDGRNRLAAMERVGVCLDDVAKLGCDHGRWFSVVTEQCDDGELDTFKVSFVVVKTDPAEYVASVNLHRRHLTAETKRDLIAKLLKENPERSDRAVGKVAQVDHKTVGVVRREEETRGNIRHVEKRIDNKGRAQPATKSKQVTAPAPETPTCVLEWSGMVPCGSDYADDHTNMTASVPGGSYIAMVVRNDSGEFSHYAVSFVTPRKKGGDKIEHVGKAGSRMWVKEFAQLHYEGNAKEAEAEKPKPTTATTTADNVVAFAQKPVADNDEGDADQDDVLDHDDAEACAYAFCGALSTMGTVPVDREEFWRQFGDKAMGPSAAEWIDSAIAKLSILKGVTLVDATAFKGATHAIGTLKQFADYCRSNAPTTVAAGVLPHEKAELETSIATIHAWLGRFAVALDDAGRRAEAAPAAEAAQ